MQLQLGHKKLVTVGDYYSQISGALIAKFDISPYLPITYNANKASGGTLFKYTYKMFETHAFQRANVPLPFLHIQV